MIRLLLIEDDELVGDGLRLLLMQAGFHVEWVNTKGRASEAIGKESYDLIVLDLNLPDGSGLDFLREIRRNANATPTVVVTARDQIKDRLEALNCGADDYIVKPINIDELVARIRAVHRRSQGRAEEVLRLGDVTLDPMAHAASYRGNPLDLSKREFAVLQLLMESNGKVVSRKVLEESVYSNDGMVASNAMEVYIHNLRKKLGSRLIRTVRGVGYKFEGDPPK